MTLFAKLSGNDIEYFDERGILTVPKPGRHSVFVGLEGCPMLNIPLPPVKEKDRNSLISQMLPAYYPGNLDRLSWDSIVDKEGTRIFLIAKKLKQRILDDCGTSSSIHSPGQGLPIREGKIIYQFKNPSGYELFFFSNGKLEYALHVDKTDEVEHLTGKLLRDGYELHKLNLSMALPGLFRKKRKFPLIWMLAIIVPMLYMLLLFIPWQRNRVMTAQLEQLERKKQELTSALSPEKETLPWEEGWKILNQHKPHDIYTWLESLYSVFEGKAKILHLQIQGNQFSITGEGNNALEILRDVTSLDVVDQVKLHQIQHSADGEIFKLSGLWK